MRLKCNLAVLRSIELLALIYLKPSVGSSIYYIYPQKLLFIDGFQATVTCSVSSGVGGIDVQIAADPNVYGYNDPSLSGIVTVNGSSNSSLMFLANMSHNNLSVQCRNADGNVLIYARVAVRVRPNITIHPDGTPFANMTNATATCFTTDPETVGVDDLEWNIVGSNCYDESLRKPYAVSTASNISVINFFVSYAWSGLSIECRSRKYPTISKSIPVRIAECPLDHKIIPDVLVLNESDSATLVCSATNVRPSASVNINLMCRQPCPEASALSQNVSRVADSIFATTNLATSRRYNGATIVCTIGVEDCAPSVVSRAAEVLYCPGPPQISPAPLEFVSGATVTISCSASNGNPDATIILNVRCAGAGNCTQASMNVGSLSNGNVTTTLIVKASKELHGAAVSCSRRNSKCPALATNATVAVAYCPTELVLSPPNVTAASGETVTATCTVYDGNPVPAIRLEVRCSGNCSTLANTTANLTVLPETLSLTYNASKEYDGATIACGVIDRPCPSAQALGSMVVTYCPSEPAIMPNPLVFNESSTAQATCTALNGNPEATAIASTRCPTRDCSQHVRNAASIGDPSVVSQVIFYASTLYHGATVTCSVSSALCSPPLVITSTVSVVRCPEYPAISPASLALNDSEMVNASCSAAGGFPSTSLVLTIACPGRNCSQLVQNVFSTARANLTVWQHFMAVPEYHRAIVSCSATTEFCPPRITRATVDVRYCPPPPVINQSRPIYDAGEEVIISCSTLGGNPPASMLLNVSCSASVGCNSSTIRKLAGDGDHHLSTRVSFMASRAYVDSTVTCTVDSTECAPQTVQSPPIAIRYCPGTQSFTGNPFNFNDSAESVIICSAADGFPPATLAVTIRCGRYCNQSYQHMRNIVGGNTTASAALTASKDYDRAVATCTISSDNCPSTNITAAIRVSHCPSAPTIRPTSLLYTESERAYLTCDAWAGHPQGSVSLGVHCRGACATHYYQLTDTADDLIGSAVNFTATVAAFDNVTVACNVSRAGCPTLTAMETLQVIPCPATPNLLPPTLAFTLYEKAVVTCLLPLGGQKSSMVLTLECSNGSTCGRAAAGALGGPAHLTVNVSFAVAPEHRGATARCSVANPHCPETAADAKIEVFECPEPSLWPQAAKFRSSENAELTCFAPNGRNLSTIVDMLLSCSPVCDWRLARTAATFSVTGSFLASKLHHGALVSCVAWSASCPKKFINATLNVTSCPSGPVMTPVDPLFNNSDVAVVRCTATDGNPRASMSFSITCPRICVDFFESATTYNQGDVITVSKLRVAPVHHGATITCTVTSDICGYSSASTSVFVVSCPSAPVLIMNGAGSREMALKKIECTSQISYPPATIKIDVRCPAARSCGQQVKYSVQGEEAGPRATAEFVPGKIYDGANATCTVNNPHCPALTASEIIEVNYCPGSPEIWPSELLFNVFETANITCTASNGKPLAEATLSMYCLSSCANSPTADSVSHSGEDIEASLSFLVSPEHDGATATCRVRSTLCTEVVKSSVISVLYCPGAPRLNPESMTFVEGDVVLITCTADQGKPKGNISLTISCKNLCNFSNMDTDVSLAGEKLSASTRLTATHCWNDATVTCTTVSTRCSVKTSASVMTVYHLRRRDRPSVFFFPSNRTRGLLNCESYVDSLPGATYQWIDSAGSVAIGPLLNFTIGRDKSGGALSYLKEKYVCIATNQKLGKTLQISFELWWKRLSSGSTSNHGTATARVAIVALGEFLLLRLLRWALRS